MTTIAPAKTAAQYVPVGTDMTRRIYWNTTTTTVAINTRATTVAGIIKAFRATTGYGPRIVAEPHFNLVYGDLTSIKIMTVEGTVCGYISIFMCD